MAKKKISIFFALDGLADTHSVYRRNVAWEKVIENAKAFIANDGRAIWKFIRFEHNKHQVDEAKKLALSLGFKDFILREDYVGEPLDYTKLRKNTTRTSMLPLSSTQDIYSYLGERNKAPLAEYNLDSLACDAKVNANIYLDSHGRLWPCCWLGQLEQTGRDNEREFFKLAVLKKYKENFNSLLHYSLEDILSHPWLNSDLENSWGRPGDDDANPLLLSCARNCADKKCV